jgi:segregation and condensation protein B
MTTDSTDSTESTDRPDSTESTDSAGGYSTTGRGDNTEGTDGHSTADRDDNADGLGRTEPPSAETLTEARRAIEAMLLVATDPTPEQLLAQLVELPSDLVGMICRELASEYDDQQRGFQLVQIAGGWRYQTHPDVHPYVERYALEGIPNRLSSAALETLAIVAYKQPISRGQIGAIRGVNVDAVLRTLVQRGYVEEHGKDDGPGQATLFGTTGFFLEQLGLMSTDDLPALGEFVPSAEVLEALEQTLKITGDEPTADVADEPTADLADEPTVDVADGPTEVAVDGAEDA